MAGIFGGGSSFAAMFTGDDIKKGSQEQSGTSTPDLNQQYLNEWKKDQLTGLYNTIGLPSFFPNMLYSQYAPAFQVSPDSFPFQGQAYAYAGQTLPNADNWYGDQYSNINQNYQDVFNTNSNAYLNARNNIGNMVNDIRQTGQNYYNTALRENNPAFDPTMALNAAENYFTQIGQPTLQNQYAGLGLSRSGALGEAQAKAIAGMALPITQQVMANRASLTNNFLASQYGLDQSLANMYGGFGQQYMNNIASQGTQKNQNLFALGQQYPNVSLAVPTTGMNLNQQAFNLSDFGRQLQQQQYMAQLGAFLSAMNASPFSPGMTQTGNMTQYGTATEQLNQRVGQAMSLGSSVLSA